MADITVPVPDDRTAEFYQFFGLWLAGELRPVGGASDTHPEAPLEGSDTRKPWGDSAQDLADAVAMWKKCSPKARAVFSLLIDNPGVRYTGDEIAKQVGAKFGAHSVAGYLAHPGRFGWKIGRPLPTDVDLDTETDQSYYYMTAKRAALFQAARAEVDGEA